VDVQPFALQLLSALLSKIEAQQSPERVAENDFLMRCAPSTLVLRWCEPQPNFWPGVARVIITAKEGLGEGYPDVLRRLVSILGVIARNPSNPNFDQHLFESISGLIL
jgi:exportin-2 (importin alpha re-exporter)